MAIKIKYLIEYFFMSYFSKNIQGEYHISDIRKLHLSGRFGMGTKVSG